MSRAAVHLVLTSLLTAGVLWQTVQVQRLEGRVAELEGGAATASPGQASTERGEKAGKAASEVPAAAVLAQLKAQQGDDATVADADPAALEEAVAAAVERKAEEKRVEGQEKWVQQSSEGIEYQLEKLAEEHGFDETAVQRAKELFVDVLYDSISLKESIEAEEISVKDAIVEGNAMRQQLRADLVATIGEEATEKLGWTIRPGKGWADD